MAFAIKPTPTLTRLRDVERLFSTVLSPSSLLKRIKKEKKSDDALFEKLINS